jgi:hypothetical protein
MNKLPIFIITVVLEVILVFILDMWLTESLDQLLFIGLAGMFFGTCWWMFERKEYGEIK